MNALPDIHAIPFDARALLSPRSGLLLRARQSFRPIIRQHAPRIKAAG